MTQHLDKLMQNLKIIPNSNYKDMHNEAIFIVDEIAFGVDKSYSKVEEMIELLLNIQSDMDKIIDICGDTLEKDYNCPSFYEIRHEIDKLLDKCYADEPESDYHY